MRALRTLIVLWAALVVAEVPRAQKPAADKAAEELRKAGRKDPFTEEDPERMKAAGIVSYGPFPWADFKTSTDVEAVLGKGRFLWVETEHFRIAFNFGTLPWPEGQAKRRYLKEEIKEVRRRLKKFPAKPKKLTPWVRLHLYVFRLERLYGEVQELLGVTDADFGEGSTPPGGKYLGLPDKYLVLLVQKKSDLARYFRRFCDYDADTSMRWYHDKTHQLLAGVAAEGLEGFDAIALHGHVRYAVTHNLLDGYKGFHLSLPMWFGEGLAHWYANEVPSDVVNAQILDSEAVARDEKQANWPVKVRRRARHEGVAIPFAEMVKWTKFEDMGYHAHAQSWSRVDYLMHLDRQKVGLMVAGLKSMPPVLGGPVPPDRVAVRAQRLLLELFGLDAKGFDEKWRAWVLKTYPKK